VRLQTHAQVAPLTPNATRVYGWQALFQVNGVPHKALTDQIRTVAKERLTNPVGTLAPVEMLAVERAIRVQLGLP
jgi:mRNA interferase MazF